MYRPKAESITGFKLIDIVLDFIVTLDHLKKVGIHKLIILLFIHLVAEREFLGTLACNTIYINTILAFGDDNFLVCLRAVDAPITAGSVTPALCPKRNVDTFTGSTPIARAAL